MAFKLLPLWRLPIRFIPIDLNHWSTIGGPDFVTIRIFSSLPFTTSVLRPQLSLPNFMTDPGKQPSQAAVLAAIHPQAMDGIITFDDTGLILSANSTTASLFACPIERLVGQNIKALMPSLFKDDGGDHDDQSSLRDWIGFRKEAIGLRSDGTTFPIHLVVSEFKVEGKSILAGIIRDVYDLNERQARLEAILNNAVDAIITIDDRGLIDSANPATEKLFGYQTEEIVGKNVKILMPNPYHDEHDGYLKNYQDTGIRKIIGIGREVVGQRKDGTVFPMHLAVSEIQLGERRLFTGIVRDISDLKKAERELAEANDRLEENVRLRTAELHEAQADLVRSEKFATLGKVSGGIAHEIRNPLNAVKTSAYYLLNAKSASPEKVEEHLHRIDRQVTVIDNVVTALSDVARMPDADLCPVNLSKLLRNVVSTVELPSNISVKFELPEDLPKVLVDVNQIVIAFRNLLRNARDAMILEGGMLRVVADVSDESVTFRIIDSGTGIEPEILKKILEPLFTTKARGLGLGLSITREIVEKNKGSLSVESEVGKGSRFGIQLKRG